MNKAFKLLSYVAVILTLLAVYLRLERGKDDREFIKELERRNDSLQAHVDSTIIKIEALNDLASGYKLQIEEDKSKLADLQAKADLFKRKYNEEHNRITELSGDALVSEFTNAFK